MDRAICVCPHPEHCVSFAVLKTYCPHFTEEEIKIHDMEAIERLHSSLALRLGRNSALNPTWFKVAVVRQQELQTQRT